jgi:hypothetical protein
MGLAMGSYPGYLAEVDKSDQDDGYLTFVGGPTCTVDRTFVIKFLLV